MKTQDQILLSQVEVVRGKKGPVGTCPDCQPQDQSAMWHFVPHRNHVFLHCKLFLFQNSRSCFRKKIKPLAPVPSLGVNDGVLHPCSQCEQCVNVVNFPETHKFHTWESHFLLLFKSPVVPGLFTVLIFCHFTEAAWCDRRTVWRFWNLAELGSS